MKRLKKSSMFTRRESKTQGFKTTVRSQLQKAGIRCSVEAIRDQYVLTHARQNGKQVYAAYCLKHEKPVKLASAASWTKRTAKQEVERMMGGKGCTRCASEAPTPVRPLRQRDRGYAMAG